MSIAAEEHNTFMWEKYCSSFCDALNAATDLLPTEIELVKLRNQLTNIQPPVSEAQKKLAFWIIRQMNVVFVAKF